jgi:hypothetical protein
MRILVRAALGLLLVSTVLAGEVATARPAAAVPLCTLTAGKPSYYYEYPNGVRTKYVLATTTISCSDVVEYIYVSSSLSKNGAYQTYSSAQCLVKNFCRVHSRKKWSAGSWNNYGDGVVEDPRYIKIYDWAPRRSTCVYIG